MLNMMKYVAAAIPSHVVFDVTSYVLPEPAPPHAITGLSIKSKISLEILCHNHFFPSLSANL